MRHLTEEEEKIIERLMQENLSEEEENKLKERLREIDDKESYPFC